MGTPPRAVFVLRERFNGADRDQSDTLLDWMARLNHQLSENWSLEVGLARKSRLPIYLERYLWIPLEVNAGLGDGNNYHFHRSSTKGPLWHSSNASANI